MIKLIFISPVVFLIACASPPKGAPVVDVPTVTVEEVPMTEDFFVTVDPAFHFSVDFKSEQYKLANTQALDSMIKVCKIREENRRAIIVFPPEVASREVELIKIFRDNGITNLSFMVKP